MMLIKENVTSNTGRVVAYPKEEIAPVLSCVFVERVAILDRHLCATIIFIEVKIHDARNCVRAVSSRSTAPGNGATRRRSTSTSVAPGSKPRSANAAVPDGPD